MVACETDQVLFAVGSGFFVVFFFSGISRLLHHLTIDSAQNERNNIKKKHVLVKNSMLDGLLARKTMLHFGIHMYDG